MNVENPRLAVVIPERNVVSESFIGSHIEGLFDGSLVVWGSPRPLFYGDGEGLLSGVWAAAAKPLTMRRGMTAARAQGAVGRRLPEPVYSRALAHFLRLAEIDVVLAEYGPTAATIMEACSISRIPLVAHFHGFDAYQEKTLTDLREPYERLFQKASRVVVVSNHMLAHLLELGSPAERTVCNPCGVDIDRFQGAKPETSPPLLLALGRFVEKKGPALTVRAFAQVHAEESESRLVMLGDGPLRGQCIDLARQLGVDQQASFPGSIDHDEVVGWMRQARCFVQHSLRAADGDCEGTPVAVLEASSCGLPVVSTRHGGIVEAVREGGSGFLVDEGDVDGMAERILRLVRDSRLAETMGAAGRRHVEANYSSQKSLGCLRLILAEAARIGAHNRQGSVRAR
jgi:colanic acid/amylovoran biosynthesis glycosyltransferase